MASRDDIFNDVRSYLNRQSEISLASALLVSWFRTAHRDAQRMHLFKTAEDTHEITYTEGVNAYPVPADWRESNPRAVAYIVDIATSKTTRFANKVNFGTVQDRRLKTDPTLIENALSVDTYETWLYAEYEGNFEVWPEVSSTLVGKKLCIPYFKWMTEPGAGENDWFTNNAADFLLYRMLMESVPVFGQPESRFAIWQGQAQSAWQRIYSHDISASISGSLLMKGA